MILQSSNFLIHLPLRKKHTMGSRQAVRHWFLEIVPITRPEKVARSGMMWNLLSDHGSMFLC